MYDAVVHSDSSHRGGSELLPATRRCMFASMLTAGATLYEPVYAVEIQCPEVSRIRYMCRARCLLIC